MLPLNKSVLNFNNIFSLRTTLKMSLSEILRHKMVRVRIQRQNFEKTGLM